jgi:preprotein translocase subunit SecD
LGTAGLNVKRLCGLLEKRKVDTVVVEEDDAHDHVVLQLSTVRQPNRIALLKYENQGVEPRLVTLTVSPLPTQNDASSIMSHTIEIFGKRADDVEKIVQVVQAKFLEPERSNS